VGSGLALGLDVHELLEVGVEELEDEVDDPLAVLVLRNQVDRYLV
jgi:hypothetical protein